LQKIIIEIWQIKALLDKREYYLHFYITKLSGKWQISAKDVVYYDPFLVENKKRLNSRLTTNNIPDENCCKL